jgi:predicted RND superfamily exporter protein
MLMSVNRFLFCRFLLPLLILLAVAGGWAWRQPGLLSVDSSADRLLASDPRNLETFEKINELIPDTVMVLVALEIEELFSNQGAGTIARATDQIYSVAGCMEVKSLTHSGRPVRSGFRLEIEHFIPQWASEAEWRRIESFTTRFPMSRNVLVSADARYAILIGVFERPLPDHAARESFRSEFIQALEPIESETDAVHVLSFPFIEAEAVNALQEDLTRYLLAAGLLIFAVLMITFRSLPAVLSVLLLEGIGVLALLGVFHLWGHSIDIYTGILFPLVGGLQLTFIVHYLAALQRETRAGIPPPGAARRAFREVFPPSSLAALTTVVGLLTLAFSDLPTLTAFGRIGAVAVILVFLVTFLLPALYAIGKHSAPADLPADPQPSRLLPIRFPLLILLPALGLSIWVATGIPGIRTDIRAIEFIEPGHPIRESLELLDRELGGTTIFQLEIDTGRNRGLQTLPVLRYLEDLRAYAYSLEGVTDAYAYSQLYLALNQIWDGDPDPDGSLPQTQTKLLLFSNLLNSISLLFEEAFVDENARSSLVILRSRDMPGVAYLEMLERFVAHAEATAPAGVTLEPVRGLHTILEGDRQLVRNQSRTLGWSAAMIGLLLALLWRSLRLAALVLLANVPALLCIFGMMGFSGFPLNSITVMVAAVLMGIAVDDGIHLVSAFRRRCKQGQEPRRAAGDALRDKCKPMACTSSILAVFLGMLAFTSFPPVAHFGLLSALGIAAAFLGAVLLLPALLSATSKSNKK